MGWLVTAPNAGEPTPAPREGEETFRSPTSPPVTIAYELVSSPSVRAPAYTVVVLHRLRDSRGPMREWAQHLADGGARTILVDARGHGRSTGDPLSYGVRESLNLVNLTDALAARGLLVGKLGVLGFSCGGATAIQWAGRDARVAAVVALAPFATMDIVRTYTKVPLPDFVVSFVVGRVGRESGFDPPEAGALPYATSSSIRSVFSCMHRRGASSCSCQTRRIPRCCEMRITWAASARRRRSRGISADAVMRQYIGGGSPGPSSGLGHAGVFERKHVLIVVSQHCTPPEMTGQLFAQSKSLVHDETHFFAGEAGGVGPDELEPLQYPAFLNVSTPLLLCRVGRRGRTPKRDEERALTYGRPGAGGRRKSTYRTKRSAVSVRR